MSIARNIQSAVPLAVLSGRFSTPQGEPNFSNVTTSYAGKGVVRYAW
jgi:hypothetical protein